MESKILDDSMVATNNNNAISPSDGSASASAIANLNHIRSQQTKYKRQMEWKLLEIVMLTFSFITALSQLALFDAYFVKYGNVHPGTIEIEADGDVNCSRLPVAELKEGLDGTVFKEDIKFFYYWIVPDLLVVAAMATFPVFHTIQFIRQLRAKSIAEEVSLIPTLKFAWVIWLIYSSVLVSKVALCKKTFLRTLQYFEDCKAFGTLGLNVFILMLCMSTVVFFCVVASHHTNVPMLKEWLSNLVEKVTFNILDAVHLLMTLFAENTLVLILKDSPLELTIIVLGCFTFILPTFALVRVHSRVQNNPTQPTQPGPVDFLPSLNKSNSAVTFSGTKKPKSKHRRRLEALLEGEFYTLLFLVFVNIPFFVIRCHLWYYVEMELSVFLLKNFIEIMLGIQKVFVGIRALIKNIK